MSPLVKKEIRLLLPSFLASLLLALSIWLVPDAWNSGSVFTLGLGLLPFLFCPMMVVMMTLGSFGREFSSGTFSMLLSQPVSRSRIWLAKTLPLIVMLVIVWFVWCISYILHNPDRCSHDELQDMEISTTLFFLVIYSGGLCSVLLLRQVAAAFWFTILVPGLILVIVTELFSHKSDEFIEVMVVVILGIYCLCGLFFARWLFFRAQDTQWSGGTIAMPEIRGLPAWLSIPAAKRMGHPQAALWRKEFQLHQSQFIIAFVLMVLHIGVLLVRQFGSVRNSHDLKFILEAFWGLWLVMPFLIGCAAVAEERKLGTHESQLCLPVKRRKQFAVKLFVVLLLSILFGFMMPVLMEGTRVLPDTHIRLLGTYRAQFGGVMPNTMTQTFFWKFIEGINLFLPLLTLAGMAAAIGTVSFYISTLTRNTLQALAPALFCVILALFSMSAARSNEFESHPLWRGMLIYYIGVPLILVTLLALGFWNFQRVVVGWKLWLRNLFAVAMSVAIIIISTAAVYHRLWEKLTPFEPPHGKARWTLSNPASLDALRWGTMSVRLPDGKIWMNQSMLNSPLPSLLSYMLGNFKVTMDAGSFINGSNWAAMKRTARELAGIKRDGTLWVSEKPMQLGRMQIGDSKNVNAMHHLVQFGNETNWSSLQAFGFSVLLVKNDGTLWRWGPDNFDLKHESWPGLRAFTPHQVGLESNWAEVFQNSYNEFFLRKTDGSIWTTDNDSSNTHKGALLNIDQALTVQLVANPGKAEFHSTTTVWHGLGYQVGIREDGTFRIWATQHLVQGAHYGHYEWSSADFQIGHVKDWVAVAGGGNNAITLREDGSLWLWDFEPDFRRSWGLSRYPYRDVHELQNKIPSQLDTHSDWIAIASVDMFSVVSLAADGSLWYWPLQREGYSNTDQYEPLLDLSPKPQFLGNIFQESN